MKLRNKKTGEIINSKELLTNEFLIDIFSKDFNYFNSKINKIQEEWEDYEEPLKPYWFINDLDGDPMKCDLKNCSKSTFIKWGNHRKQIGNYFETKEEAEKAVEKLKAWKRLKDKGFRFNKWTIPEEPKTPHIKLVIEAEMDVPDSPYDLDLLFGGEE